MRVAKLVRSTLPVAVLALVGCAEEPTAPTGIEPVSGGRSWRDVRTGYLATCAVTTEDLPFCWGYNDFGQVGDGTTTQRLTPKRVAGGLRFRGIVPGTEYACGRTTGNKVYCWGRNEFGEVGDGTRDMRLQPVPVAGNITFRQVSTGGTHTCG